MNVWKFGVTYSDPDFMLNENIIYAFGDSMPTYLKYNIGSIEKGDIVFIAKSMQKGIIKIGVATSKSFFCNENDIKAKEYVKNGIDKSTNDKLIEKFKEHEFNDVVYCDVDWLDINPKKLKVSFNNQYGFTVVNDSENIIKYVKKNIRMEQFVELLINNKNIVLTGAPGTGKTYLAKEIAKQIIGIKTDEELEKSGKFAFVQFHPSYDYTDFVEGLRPTKPDEKGNIGFELKNGIFKDFCKKAIDVSAITSGQIVEFTFEGYEMYLKALELNSKTINNYKLRIEQLLGQKEINSKREIVDKEIYNSLDEICDNLDIIKDFDDRNKQHRQFTSSVSNLINFRNSLSTKLSEKSETKPNFVFVIDEINRGEISKIFGELFFAIDPSYRGKKGNVKTQYSNMQDNEDEAFYVPDNVYIIGSMNDIDRSVESFDFAMRRRFTWKEITAKESAENMNLPEKIKSKMEKLNEQISKIEGLNASYHIGGAYFLDADGKARRDYDTIWNYRIEPLLKEYLRGIPDEDEKIETLKKAYSA